MIQYSATIMVPMADVWRHLLYKIECPEAFVPGVSDVKILEKREGFVRRKMTIKMPDGTINNIEEEIIFAPYQVRFNLVSHPKFSGYVDNIITPISEKECLLTYSIHWQDKATLVYFSDENIVKNAVLKSVAHIQSQSNETTR